MPGLRSTPTVLKLGIAGVVLCAGASALLLYAAPADLRGVWGIQAAGARMYLDAAGLPIDVAPLGRETFVWAFRALVVLSWLSWLVMIRAAFGGARITTRAAAVLVATTAVVLAIAGPPVLSSDAFAYVSYGRLVYAHGLNPYEHGRAALEAAGDPSASFLFVPVLMPYGPLWPLLIALLGPIGTMGGLFGELLVHKLLAAVCLIVAAIAGSRAAEAWTPGRGLLTFLAIGLNPLLFVEAAVGGHNDILPVALVAIASACSLTGRHRLGALSFGLAVATKATAIGALPLLLLDRWVHEDRRSRWREVAWAAALAIGPFIALSYVFGGPTVVLGVVRERVGIVAPIGASAWIARALVTAGLAHGLWSIWRGSRRTRGMWITAWVIVSAAIVLASTTLRFPWYLAWPLVPALAKWDERHRILITGIAACSVLATWLYTVGP